MDDTRVWFYAVMIFIAFVSWLRKRIRDVAAARNERGDSQQNQRQEEDRRRQESSQSSVQQSSAPRQPSSLKELFQQVAAEQAEAQRQALQQHQQQQQRQVQTQAPPPLPVSTQDEGFHQAEAAFHQQDDAATKHERTVPIGSMPRRKRRLLHPANRTRTAIREAFSDRRKIRDAFILKEILDTPKGMQ